MAEAIANEQYRPRAFAFLNRLLKEKPDAVGDNKLAASILAHDAVKDSLLAIHEADPESPGATAVVDLLFTMHRRRKFYTPYDQFLALHAHEAFTRARDELGPPTKRWWADGTPRPELATLIEDMGGMYGLFLFKGARVDKDSLLPILKELGEGSPEGELVLQFLTTKHNAGGEIIPALYGYDFEELRRFLHMGYGPDSLPSGKVMPSSMPADEYMTKGFAVLPTLNRMRPGIWQHLQRHHKIRNTSRYPQQLLLDTYNTFDTIFDSNVIALVAAGSKNPAMLQHAEKLAALQQALHGQNIGLRILELAGLGDIQDGLIHFLRQKWAPSPLHILSAHGTPRYIDFCDGERDYPQIPDITLAETRRYVAPLIARTLSPGGQFVGLTCHFMDKGGIGEAIYDGTDRQVVGGMGSICVRNLTLQIQDGVPRIEPSFAYRQRKGNEDVWEYSDAPVITKG
ncbi:MAG TPA: hypothetical protein VD735_00620 [Candidatus Saccharimonadales bacterium]|nr:hypothetical protein [Candidatus Saccharimonadales bacterium]